MKEIQIKDITPELVTGVKVKMPRDGDPYCESYFEWRPSSLVMDVKNTDMTGGVLKSWHHVPVFEEVETHEDAEMFYFFSGTALMLFVDIMKGRPVMDTAQIVRIQAGTQLIILAGKGHFVPVAESETPVSVIVEAPVMEAPRITLPEIIKGINED